MHYSVYCPLLFQLQNCILNHSWWLFPGHYYWLEPSHAFENFREYEVGLLALSFLQGSFAYGGWNFLNYVTEELVDPCR